MPTVSPRLTMQRVRASEGEADDYRRLFGSAPTPLFVVERETLHFAAVNAAATRAMGYSEAEFLASSLVEYLDDGDRQALLGTQGLPVPGLLEARSSWTLTRRDGTRLRTEVAGGPALVFHGRPCALLFQPPEVEPTARDVRLDGVDLASFSFSALHDLKEPLHLVKGYLDLLDKSDGGRRLDPMAREFLDSALNGTHRMQALVLNLLEYFRADAKGIAPEPLELADVLQDTLRGLSLQVQEANAVVTNGPLPRVVADRVQIGRVLQNLLSNALKFRSANPPHVHVEAAVGPGSWEVVVKDDGIGIAAKDLERVLHPFQRAHSVDQYPGTGLGLSICKKIVELHGGRLWLVSAPGQGTEVHFTLPNAGGA